ncbi:glycoside hydrolase family 16 protein [Thermothelomyces thermophilus ATCC 42464]|uniref:Glycoside hydrolase family 16 protein n=1 Tax=Thermothelomyces thermophilus (strain ATCC 42464 / BCRC 31852 / DSM 1799) TaxID=573729 RepID=G2QIR7_THET4|nr:glycoside hydrolase family 16 protein [Thermothelomyces thermophilus ATCC 42464]AEO60389.1 glycoside hydrolase family 16 protein [Thermothelomyces thermophilus ATCC 42464]
MVTLSTLARAVSIPALAGWNIVSTITFDGEAGKSVDQSTWEVITNIHVNNEVQEYTTSPDNAHLSGNGTLLIIPLKSETGQWTSARLGSKQSFTPEDGKTTRYQSELRFGDSPQDKQQGIWPAFWMLGQSSREGTPWPECGELDIMERKNGEPTGHGTPHCGTGDSCGGLTKSVPLDGNGWHTWAIEIDRTNKNWADQTISWFLDDNKYNSIKGSDVQDEDTWKAIAHSPMYFILNIAVGGDWPGKPNDQTADGMDNMMEVKYIAIYSK